MKKKNIFACTLALVLTAGLAVGGFFVYKDMVKQPENVNEGSSPQQVTEITDFVFDGNKVVAYVGNDSSIKIPASYKRGEDTWRSTTFNSFDDFNNDFPDKVDLYMPSLLELTDAEGVVSPQVTVFTDWFDFESMSPTMRFDYAFPVTVRYKVATYYTGNDVIVTELGGSHESPFQVKNDVDIKEIVLPNTIKKIDDEALVNYEALETINLENVNTIGKSAFSGCVKLTELDCSSCSQIGDQAFNGCSQLKSVKTKDGVMLGKSVFAGTQIEM